MPNRLVGETSPYLLQHAENPVDWFPWGDEALSLARRENKLIFLSVGYAACHWCHVMEHESFEDEAVADILNRDFVSIKVDREERPDLDEIYMAATMLFSGGHGGWPMSVFLAPNLKPVYAGTYFPREDAYGRPGFKSLLRFLQQKWRLEKDALQRDADRVADAVRRMHQQTGGSSIPGPEHVPQAAAAVYRAIDQVDGGIASGVNKFPQSHSLELLLRAFRSSGTRTYLDAVELTLERMCQGGIYDHLGGGIHRYATDSKWLVPHFEKMLYDQALVVSALVQGGQASGDDRRTALFEERIRGICDYVLADLCSSEGAFHSSEDADSEGKEGKFYVWTREEIRDLLGEADGKLFASHYDVTDYGNWTHPGDDHVPHGPKNVLHVARAAEVLAKLEGLSRAEVESILVRSRRKLLEARQRRIRPGLDDKILTGWNGLMIAALARAANSLRERRYGDAASRAARFVLSEMRSGDRLLATFGKGRARLAAYSTDYAFMAEGLVAVYEWSGETEFLLEAERLVDTLVEHYWDETDGGFYLTASDHEQLIVRSRTVQDGATPSANSTMALVLQKLAILLGRSDFRKKAGRILEAFVDPSLRSVFQQELLLSALEAWHGEWKEVAVVGPRDDPRTEDLLHAIHAGYEPNMVVAWGDGRTAKDAARIPLLAGRPMVDGQPTVYVCRDYACDRPVTDPAAVFA